MSKSNENTSYKKLLEKLQEDSWQLELLISGFAIFGLFSAIDPVNNAYMEAVKGGETIFYTLIFMVKISLYIMIFNLTLHIILRGLWIGALGLRYVSGDIDYEALNYSNKFTKYLKRKVGSFDNYIGKLEDYCSIIFAISFLLIFYVISAIIIVMINQLIVSYVFNNESFPHWLAYGLGWILIGLLFIASFLAFVDLVTGGWIKKNEKISKFYFPFYIFISFITFSFLYRPLVYNFLDDKFGKKIHLLLIPFFSIVILISAFHYQKSNFFTGYNKSNTIIANRVNYEDLIEQRDIEHIMIDFMVQSKVITDNYLKIYLPYHPAYEDVILKFNPGLEPKKDKRGIRFSMFSSNSIPTKELATKDSLRLAYMKTFNRIFKIQIDSTSYKTSFHVDKIWREKFGFESFINIENLNNGKHMLIISQQIKKDSIGDRIITTIPFWYFKK